MLRLSFLLAVLMTLTACGGVDPDSPLGKRKAIFKQMLNVSEDLGGMLRGRIKFDEQVFIDNAVLLDEISRQPWQHFEDDAATDNSAARDDVWQKKKRFAELAQELEGTTARLVQSTAQQPLNLDVLATRVDLVEKACESCHQEFRVY